LAKKLGIKEGHLIQIINQPDYYWDLFSDLPPIKLSENKRVKKNLIHFFTKSLKEYIKVLPKLKDEMLDDGMIWVSWPKKASKIETDITENNIRDYALEIGLVDIKVCAVDDIWSGLKLVIPVKDRLK
jgi:hypothetical protein